MPSGDFLEYISRFFPAVELDGVFYRLLNADRVSLGIGRHPGILSLLTRPAVSSSGGARSGFISIMKFKNAREYQSLA
jgi:hypothetical protein